MHIGLACTLVSHAYWSRMQYREKAVVRIQRWWRWWRHYWCGVRGLQQQLPLEVKTVTNGIVGPQLQVTANGSWTIGHVKARLFARGFGPAGQIQVVSQGALVDDATLVTEVANDASAALLGISRVAYDHTLRRVGRIMLVAITPIVPAGVACWQNLQIRSSVMNPFSCSRIRRTLDMRHAACDVRHATAHAAAFLCNMHHATCNMQHAECKCA